MRSRNPLFATAPRAIFFVETDQDFGSGRVLAWLVGRLDRRLVSCLVEPANPPHPEGDLLSMRSKFKP